MDNSEKQEHPTVRPNVQDFEEIEKFKNLGLTFFGSGETEEEVSSILRDEP